MKMPEVDARRPRTTRLPALYNDGESACCSTTTWSHARNDLFRMQS